MVTSLDNNLDDGLIILAQGLRSIVSKFSCGGGIDIVSKLMRKAESNGKASANAAQ